ncbi:hypothetical protein PBI_MIMI_158 [Arthrobacter phage Mimi]|nr:hypothetical protein PBI_MIMI_238 [Arthrobacter phage Mimi]
MIPEELDPEYVRKRALFALEMMQTKDRFSPGLIRAILEGKNVSLDTI